MSLPDGGRVGARASDTDVSLKDSGRSPAIEARMVAVESLRANRLQPRAVIEEAGIAELARSIATKGVIQPIVVRETEDGLEIAAGERRWRAAKLAGLESVPVVLRQATDEEMLELALIENIHREDLNAVDRASAYRLYCDEFGLTAEEVGERLNEDRTTVANYLRLLELPLMVQDLLAGGGISMGHARSLLGVGDEVRKVELARRVAAEGMSVRKLEALVRREHPRRAVRARIARATVAGVSEAHLRDIECKFEEVLGTKVKIHLGPSRTRGHVVIEFFSLDEFEGLCRKMGVIRNKDKG
ncbi:MAG: ParB/RepB/Spo0J family partition protein [Phycisphaerae bacterium]